MLAERYLRRRYREGRQEGREEGLKEGLQEGLKEGLQEGRAEANEAWQAWYQRMVAAREEGREFDEPPSKQWGEQRQALRLSTDLTHDETAPRSGLIHLAWIVVGAVRFELTTPCTPCRCAPGLRHAPTVAPRLT